VRIVANKKYRTIGVVILDPSWVSIGVFKERLVDLTWPKGVLNRCCE
jgi:hypothetical protein